MSSREKQPLLILHFDPQDISSIGQLYYNSSCPKTVYTFISPIAKVNVTYMSCKVVKCSIEELPL